MLDPMTANIIPTDIPLFCKNLLLVGQFTSSSPFLQLVIPSQTFHWAMHVKLPQSNCPPAQIRTLPPVNAEKEAIQAPQSNFLLNDIASCQCQDKRYNQTEQRLILPPVNDEKEAR